MDEFKQLIQIGRRNGSLSDREVNLAFLLHPLALADVADGAGNQRTFLGLEGAEADLNGKLATVFMQTIEFQTNAHRSHARLSREGRAVPRVLVSEPFWHQHLDFSIEQILSPVPKELFDLRVNQDDLPLLVRDD